MTIKAKQKNGVESFEIDIESSRIDQLMDIFGDDLTNLANHLNLMDDRMVLLNPKYD